MLYFTLTNIIWFFKASKDCITDLMICENEFRRTRAIRMQYKHWRWNKCKLFQTSVGEPDPDSQEFFFIGPGVSQKGGGSLKLFQTLTNKTYRMTNVRGTTWIIIIISLKYLILAAPQMIFWYLRDKHFQKFKILSKDKSRYVIKYLGKAVFAP